RAGGLDGHGGPAAGCAPIPGSLLGGTFVDRAARRASAGVVPWALGPAAVHKLTASDGGYRLLAVCSGRWCKAPDPARGAFCLARKRQSLARKAWELRAQGF